MVGSLKYVFLIFTFVIFFAPLQAQQKSIEAPNGMISIKGGKTTIGANDGPSDERPSFQTYIKPFFLDTKPVTVGQFRLFVRINQYITDAEKSGKAPVRDPESQGWKDVEGANWEYPEGKDGKKAANHEPVRQVSWNDAKAYANWLGKRLPTEYELEFVARQKGQYALEKLDGSFWYWCDNWYAPYDDDNYYSKQLNRKKTLKGGSINPNPGANSEFRPSGRSSGLPNSFSFEIGFRCASDL